LRGAPFLENAESQLYVPLRHQEQVIGLVKLGERKDRKPYSRRDLQSAQVIADYASSALNTVSRLGRIDKVPMRDPETGVHTAAFLADYFEKERNKAVRFQRPLSVLFLQFENWSFLMEQTRENVVSGALVSVIDSMRKALRDSDLLARQDANRFCIVLPETDAYGALLAIRRQRKAIREKNRFHFLGTEFSIQPFFMSATFPRDGRYFQELLRVAEEKQAPSAARLEMERTRLLRAPTVVAVISRVTPNPAAPEWEQILSCGAACFNLCLAANALGFGTAWITEWYAYSPGVRAGLRLADNQRVAGFIYIGTARERQPDRDRPSLGKIATHWAA
jgi:diguanylate cyclase (GGDEF)-like protein